MPENIETRIKDNPKYYEKYNQLKKIISERVDRIETSALLKSVQELKEAIKEAKGKPIDDILNQYPIVLLNNHSIGHIDHVLERAEDLLACISEENIKTISQYEILLLMCGVLVHDVGNLQGRNGHEIRVQKFLNQYCKSVLIDAFERKNIGLIASVHGGDYLGNKDTISCIQARFSLNSCEVKARFIAALLRFADELADDATRINLFQISENEIPEESRIFHYYSKCLHTVKVRKDDYSSVYIQLTFALSIEDATKTFKTFSGEQYLLDEIYCRTLKMERERIYCNKYLKPLLFIDRIGVEINIYDPTITYINLPTIKYELEDKGYPPLPNIGVCGNNKELLTGKQLCVNLKKVQEETNNE